MELFKFFVDDSALSYFAELQSNNFTLKRFYIFSLSSIQFPFGLNHLFLLATGRNFLCELNCSCWTVSTAATLLLRKPFRADLSHRDPRTYDAYPWLYHIHTHTHSWSGDFPLLFRFRLPRLLAISFYPFRESDRQENPKWNPAFNYIYTQVANAK